MGAHKRKCCTCGQRHAKPTGAKCERVAAELNELQGDVKVLLQCEDGMEGCPGDIEESCSNGDLGLLGFNASATARVISRR